MKNLSYELSLIIFFISQNSLALDCKKTSANIEKLICESEILSEKDQNYNDIYNKALDSLSKENGEIFKKRIKDLTKAKNNCSNLYNKKISNSHKIRNTISESSKFYSLNKTNFQKGCVATWYDSASAAISLSSVDEDFFKIPTSSEYVKSFNNLIRPPYIFDWQEIDQDLFKYCKNDHKNDPDFDCSYMRSYFIKQLSYKLFFSNEVPNFTQIISNEFSYTAGAAHGSELASSKFLVNNNFTSDIGRSSYQCSIPIKNPVVIENNIYLPEKISFTKFFEKTLGKYDEFQCYACSGTYAPDCLLRLKNFDNKSDNFIILKSENFTEEPVFNQDKIASESIRKCALKIIKDHKTEINQEDLQKIPEFQNQNEEFIFVKESAFEVILEAIRSDCLGEK